MITYLTLDNSGMLMIFLCKSYEDGAYLIDGFHRDNEQDSIKRIGVELSYSFTVAAVQKQFLGSEHIQKLNGQLLERVYIYGIERYLNSITNIYNLIKVVLDNSLDKKESVLGCNDEMIYIENVPWSDFLKLYQDNTGVLNHSSPDYNKYLMG